MPDPRRAARPTTAGRWHTDRRAGSHGARLVVYGEAVPTDAPRPARTSGTTRTSPSPGAVPVPHQSGSVPRQERFTFRANAGVGRHGWLRLTPAYGVALVRERLAHLNWGSVVVDPFCGTGTTPLAAAEAGLMGQALDINPFLLWFARVKTAEHTPERVRETHEAARELAARVGAALAAPGARGQEMPWVPPLKNIERWWTPGALTALAHLRAGIDEISGGVADLLEVALCRTLISASSAAFNHQSMSFSRPVTTEEVEVDEDEWRLDAQMVVSAFTADVEHVLSSAREPLPGTGVILPGDAREALSTLDRADGWRRADMLLTSPPYCNRMSYVRELRPYMYWTRHLHTGAQAGELDWQAIGGTWGSATSKLGSWEPSTTTPVDEQIARVGALIEGAEGKNARAMSTYVHRYHHDMWLHLQAAVPSLKRGGELCYVVGNSTFFGHEVPVQEWLAMMLAELGVRDVAVEVVRKRSSKKALYEYAVTGRRPKR